MTQGTVQDDRCLAQAIAREVARRGGTTYYVGGCVRDQVLGRESKDIDIEVHGISAAALDEILAQFGHADVVGASFGIVNLKGHTLDIALPRREGAENRSGHDLAAVTDPFLGTLKAARRRDLTMNALYQDVLTDEVIDHFGGLDDLREGIIRHVDATTFAEDPLRVLRAAQFAARFGMTVAPETVTLCASLDLTALAAERVLGELRKALLKAERPSVFFEELRRMGQLSPWFAEVAALIDVPQNPAFHPEGDVWNHTMRVLNEAARLRAQAEEPFGLMLAALCHDLGKASTTTTLDNGRIVSYGHETAGIPLAQELLGRLGASTREQAYVLNMVELHMVPNANVAQHARQKSYNHLFDRSVCPRDLLLLSQSDGRGSGDGKAHAEAEAELVEHLQAFEELMKRPFAQGRDLLELGIEPGPQMGEVLRYAHKMRLAGMDKDDQLRQCLGYWRSISKHQDGQGGASA